MRLSARHGALAAGLAAAAAAAAALAVTASPAAQPAADRPPVARLLAATAHPGVAAAERARRPRVETRPAAAEPRREFEPFLLVDAADAVARGRPGGAVVGTLPATTQLGTPIWLWAVDTSSDGRMARVILPWRPNGRTGWISLRGRDRVATRVWVRADLSERRLWLMDGRRVLRAFPAGIGGTASPTPPGRYSVTDPVATGDPNGSFGWYAFGLSGHQPQLPPGWSGGDQLAIHGTNDPSSIGRARSAGCLRVSARALGILKARLRLGTPVVIER